MNPKHPEQVDKELRDDTAEQVSTGHKALQRHDDVADDGVNIDIQEVSRYPENQHHRQRREQRREGAGNHRRDACRHLDFNIADFNKAIDFNGNQWGNDRPK